MMPRRRRASGFTLVEVLVASALSAFVAISVLSVVSQGTASAARIEEKGRRSALALGFFHVLEEDVQGIYWVKGWPIVQAAGGPGPGATVLAFETTADRKFTVGISAQAIRSRAKVSYQIVGASARGGLSLTRIEETPSGAGTVAERRTSIVVEGIQALRVEFLGEDGRGSASSGTPAAPKALRVTLTFPEAEENGVSSQTWTRAIPILAEGPISEG